MFFSDCAVFGYLHRIQLDDTDGEAGLRRITQSPSEMRLLTFPNDSDPRVVL
jgi:hypothetical protein